MLKFEQKEIHLACGATDMRKSINGLAALVEGSFNLNLFSSAIFAFCNKNRDRVKILEWSGDGFWLYFKRLEKGHFKWPGIADEDEPTMLLNEEEFEYLLGGPKVIQKIMRQEIQTRAVI